MKADAETQLACATDLVNSWSRESNLPECKHPYEGLHLRDAIDRLWSKYSAESHKLRETLALLKAYEAWEGDIILNGDWGPEGMHPYPRLREAQYEEMMRLQAERNLILHGNTMGNLP